MPGLLQRLERRQRRIDRLLPPDITPRHEGDTPADDPLADRGYADWLRAMFPAQTAEPFGPHHEQLWLHIWPVTPADTPDPFVGIWARGGGKSETAELACAALGLRGRRRYALYVSDTQDQADDHVGNVAALFEHASVERYYSAHARRMVGKYGTSKGWRRNRIRTAGGFTVDALGLDTASRGVKLEGNRPDVIIFDDIDREHDTERATQKKIATLTKSVLPAGTTGTCLVIAIQNLIIPNGIFARLSDGRADFLARRVVSGPVPAVYDLKTQRRLDGERYRSIITGGTASWAGQPLPACQALMDRIGHGAFVQECQHDVHEREGALWKRAAIQAGRETGVSHYRRVVVGVDPSGGKAEIGIIVAGLRHDGHADVVADYSCPGLLGPNHWASQVVRAYDDWEADAVIAEKNFGGDMVASTIKTVSKGVPVKLVPASRGKAVRAEPVASLYGDADIDYADAQIHHVGTFPELETEMTSWVQGDESPNRLDALVWALTELMLKESATGGGALVAGI